MSPGVVDRGDRLLHDGVAAILRGDPVPIIGRDGAAATPSALDQGVRRALGIEPDEPEETPLTHNLAGTQVPAGDGIKAQLDAIRTATFESFDPQTRQAIVYGSPEASALYDQLYTQEVERVIGGGAAPAPAEEPEEAPEYRGFTEQ